MPAAPPCPRPRPRRLTAASAETTPFRLPATALAMLWIAVAAGSARAQTCVDDTDCPDRFTCEKVGSIPCSDVKPCPQGQTCPEQPACAPMDLLECRSPDCSTDADCPTDMVCWEQTSTACTDQSAPACKPGADCPDAGDGGSATDAGQPDCTTTTSRSCVPRYVPPCKTDADCGAGFTCKAQQRCACSGGAGILPDGGVAMSQPDQCTCEPSGTSYCELQRTECSSAGDCPSGFSCGADPNAAVCSSAGGSGTSSGSSGGAAGAAAVEQDGGQPADLGGGACPDAGAPAMLCLPPYYELGFNRSGGATAADAEQAGKGGGADGGAGSATSDAGTTHTAVKTKSKSHGCAVAADDTQASLLQLLGLLGLAVLRRRRAHD